MCDPPLARFRRASEVAASISAGRAERHAFEYYRHDTLSLYAAVDTQSGKVLGKTAARHTSQEFVEFLTEVVERAPTRRVHIIWTICRRTRVR
jgi:hypothetical protein